ncbi:uncharacterized protein LOC111252127 isoform X1 [Varroa destructor]|uniref:Uncharacterized protein n=1 Tax=Varroa destructor TaxID=109461 RepID=A0A7M7KDR7_VARDE|nr:uncharacterized protein LOC111252127 isoform X1 [Varroa destructor]
MQYGVQYTQQYQPVNTLKIERKKLRWASSEFLPAQCSNEEEENSGEVDEEHSASKNSNDPQRSISNDLKTDQRVKSKKRGKTSNVPATAMVARSIVPVISPKKDAVPNISESKNATKVIGETTSQSKEVVPSTPTKSMTRKTPLLKTGTLSKKTEKTKKRPAKLCVITATVVVLLVTIGAGVSLYCIRELYLPHSPVPQATGSSAAPIVTRAAHSTHSILNTMLSSPALLEQPIRSSDRVPRSLADDVSAANPAKLFSTDRHTAPTVMTMPDVKANIVRNSDVRSAVSTVEDTGAMFNDQPSSGVQSDAGSSNLILSNTLGAAPSGSAVNRILQAVASKIK